MGIVTHPAWDAYFQANKEPLQTWEDDERWFTEHGWAGTPSEEITCEDCQGRKVITQRVTLAEALAVLKGEQ